jgi:hypothetical protein
MNFELKLVSIWKFVTLSVIIGMTLLSAVINLFLGNELLCVILGFPILFGSMIISAFISIGKMEIDINNGILTINNKTHIAIDQIEWYNQETNFLLDGIRIKTLHKKNYFFTTISLFQKDPNFKLFKDILINKSLDYKLQERTTRQLYTENKLFRHTATVAMVLYVLLLLFTLLGDIKIERIKLIYGGMIIIGNFIATRK